MRTYKKIDDETVEITVSEDMVRLETKQSLKDRRVRLIEVHLEKLKNIDDALAEINK